MVIILTTIRHDIVDGKGKEINASTSASSVGSVKHDVGKRRDLVAHFAFTLPLSLVTQLCIHHWR